MKFESLPEKKRPLNEVVDEGLRQLEEPSTEKKPDVSRIVAEAMLDSVEDGSIDLATIPEKDIPAYHQAIMQKMEVWRTAMKKLEDRMKEVNLEDLEKEQGPERKAA